MIEEFARAGQIIVQTGWGEDVVFGQLADEGLFVGDDVRFGWGEEDGFQFGEGLAFLRGSVDFGDQVGRDFAEEEGRNVFFLFILFGAGAGVADVDLDFGAGEGDVEEASFVFFGFQFFVDDFGFD